MQREVPLNKPPRFTQLLEISFKGSVLAAEQVELQADGPRVESDARLEWHWVASLYKLIQLADMEDSMEQ